jgi:hypothetical protein
MVAHLNRPAIRPADFLTINKQIEQLGEVPHGDELVVKPDLECPATVAGALLDDLGPSARCEIFLPLTCLALFWFVILCLNPSCTTYGAPTLRVRRWP